MYFSARNETCIPLLPVKQTVTQQLKHTFVLTVWEINVFFGFSHLTTKHSKKHRASDRQQELVSWNHHLASLAVATVAIAMLRNLTSLKTSLLNINLHFSLQLSGQLFVSVNMTTWKRFAETFVTDHCNTLHDRFTESAPCRPRNIIEES